MPPGAAAWHWCCRWQNIRSTPMRIVFDLARRPGAVVRSLGGGYSPASVYARRGFTWGDNAPAAENHPSTNVRFASASYDSPSWRNAGRSIWRWHGSTGSGCARTSCSRSWQKYSVRRSVADQRPGPDDLQRWFLRRARQGQHRPYPRHMAPRAGTQPFQFDDPRLTQMLFRYRARNYPDSLSAAERTEWDEYPRSA